jgi:hypothetical protein
MAGQDDSRDTRAKAILADATTAPNTTDRQDLTAILRELSDLDYARNLLSAKIEIESNRASELVVDQVEGQLKRTVVELAATLLAVHDKHKAFRQLVDVLNNDGGKYPPAKPGAL